MGGELNFLLTFVCMYRGFQNVGGNVKPGGLACSGGCLSRERERERERERV